MDLTQTSSLPASTSPLTPQESFGEEKRIVTAIIGEYTGEDGEANNAAVRREVRRFDVNIGEYRVQRKIADDETYIPRRLINQAIEGIRPAYLSYLTSSSTIVAFSDINDPTANFDAESIAFTSDARYPGYEKPWLAAIDATCLHGFSALEVRYEENNPEVPLKFVFEAIPRDEFIMPCKQRDINSAHRIIIKKSLYPNTIIAMAKSMGFNMSVVAATLGTSLDPAGQLITRDIAWTQTYDIYKVFRLNPLLECAWMSLQAQEFLKPYAPYPIGIVARVPGPPDPITGDPTAKLIDVIPDFYNIIPFPIEYTEEPELFKQRGYAQRVIHDQEAATLCWTAIINGTHRASKLSGIQEDIGDPVENETFRAGQIAPKGVTNIHQASYPDAAILPIVNALTTSSLAERGMTNFAALNREDSRKTATEVAAASRDQAQLSVSQVIALAITLKDAYSMGWKITRSQILAGIIVHPSLTPAFASRNLRIAAAGDQALLLTKEQKEQLMAFWPVIANTPAAPAYFAYMLRVFFPKQSTEWISALDQQNPAQIIQQLLAVLNGLPPEVTEALSGEERQALANIMQNAMNYVSRGNAMATGPANAGSATGPNQPPETAAETGGGTVEEV